MPRQVYRCPEHGEFEQVVIVGEDVPKQAPCQKVMGRGMTHWYCLKASPWIPSAPNFIGGPTTGAKKE